MTYIKNREEYISIKGNFENNIGRFQDHYIAMMRQDLLEYRRKNNIFETGDKIIYPWVGNEICTYDSNCIIKTPCVHATDEEIKVGHKI